MAKLAGFMPFLRGKYTSLASAYTMHQLLSACDACLAADQAIKSGQLSDRNALERLIHREWTTAGTLDYLAGEANKFQGFYGDYELEIETDQGVFRRDISLSKFSENRFEINLDEVSK